MTTNPSLQPLDTAPPRPAVRRRFPIGVAVGLAIWGVHYFGFPLLELGVGRLPLVVTARSVGLCLGSLAVIVLLHRRATLIGIAVGLLLPLVAVGIFLAGLSIECAHTQCFAF